MTDTLATADRILREDYLPALVEQVNRFNPLLARHEAGATRRKMRRMVRLGLLTLLALNLFDLASTFTAIALGAKEANPVAHLLLMFPPVLIVVKLGIVLSVWRAAIKAPAYKALAGVYLVVGVYSMVALNNSMVIWRLAHA